jgi:acetyl-CoA carboxylase carboxyl transferase subunit beta
VVVRIGPLAVTGQPAIVIAQDASGGRQGRIRPAGFRKAVRALRLADRLGLPVVSVIDTRGADPLADSEAAGVAGAIAECFVAMLDCRSPTLAVVTGEGGSGGALAMAVADRVIAWEHAVFSVIAPEGAAVILHKDGSRAPEVAEQLGITTPDLVRLKIVDEVVAEPPGGAQNDPVAALDDLGHAVASSIEDLVLADPDARLAARHERWRGAGNEWLRTLSPPLS